jgi:predicted HAD superfamily Cof-like phosphohydrolase
MRSSGFGEARPGHRHADLIGDTEEFYRRFFKDLPEFDIHRLHFRMRFLEEEFNETKRAYEKGDAEGFVDGLIDYMVVTLGTLYEAGVDIGKAWDVVHTANMAKVKNENPSRFGSAGFDLIKPPGWVAPSHADNLGRLSNIK